MISNIFLQNLVKPKPFIQRLGYISQDCKMVFYHDLARLVLFALIMR